MDKELKEKWVTALRSGEYRQTTGELKDEYGYCCLGVLCDIANVKRDGGVFVDNAGFPLRGDGSSYGKFYPRFARLYSTRNTLMRMNDTGKSLEQIADWIEDNL